MGNLFRRARKSSRKELTTEPIEAEKEKARQRSYNHRHSIADIRIGPTPPIQMEYRNSMGSIMGKPLVTSIPNISTNFKYNYASNPSSSTHWVESQLHYNLLKEVGYEQGDHNEFSEGVPITVDEAIQKMNNVVQSPIQNFNVTSLISHGRKCTHKCIQVDESALSSMKGKIPKHTICRHCSKIIKQYFEPKYDAGKC